MYVSLQNTCIPNKWQHTILLRYFTFPVAPCPKHPSSHPLMPKSRSRGKFSLYPVYGLFPGRCSWAVHAPGLFHPLLLWPPVPRSAPWKRFELICIPFFPISFLSVPSVSTPPPLDCRMMFRPSSWALHDELSDVLDFLHSHLCIS